MTVPRSQTTRNTDAVPPVSIARFPEESWLLGSAKALTRSGLDFFERCERTAGIVHTRFLTRQVYVITDPGAIADVLVKQPRSFTKPYLLRRMKVLFGNGLLTSEGDEWMRNRHIVQPAFQSDQFPPFTRFVCDNAEEMTEQWADGEVRDVYPDLLNLCLKNLALPMFGVFDAELEDLVRALANSCQQVTHSIFNVIRPSPLLYPSRLKRDLDRTLANMAGYLDRMIARRQDEPHRNDLLGLLLTGGGHHQPLSRQAVLDESVTMLLAGHETAAAGLVWCLYLLARHPDFADALAADLDAQLGDECLEAGQLDQLTLLRAALDESLRLYPPTHRIGRTVNEPVTVGGHALNVGAEVLLPQWAVHRSARWYDQPDVYKPERWTQEFRQSLPRFAYFPFSGGPRACVGVHFVWFETLVILSVLARRFRFSREDSAPLLPYEGLTLLPADGQLRLRIERRSARPRSST